MRALYHENMKFIGAHVSVQGGIYNTPINAFAIGAKAFAFFTKNQRQWFSEPYSTEDVTKFRENLKKYGFLSRHLLAHASYLINLGSPEPSKRKLSVNSLIDECRRCALLGADNIVVHPGSHLRKISEEESMEYVADSVNKVLAATSDVTVVLESTAGQGSNLGYCFEHLGYIISRVDDKNRVGVCLDTCHLFASGYDFLTKDRYNHMLESFDQLVGLKYLRGMHLNDSKEGLRSRLDRHASLGEGKIGWEPFKFIMEDSRLENLPLILETSNPDLWKQEIATLYSFV
jgi:deoxyribonuclease-4